MTFADRLRKLSPARILCLGFLLVIVTGGFLLWLPISMETGKSISFIDAMFISTSAVCVTGLTTVEVGNTFNLFGEIVIALLIQIGGLGISTIGIIFVLLAKKRIGLKSRQIIKESLNFSNYQGLVKTLKCFILIAFGIEAIGAFLSFFVFIQDYPFLQALKISIFHSVSAFNNAGFDILGGFDSLLAYQDHLWLNLITCVLVILGGLGFLVEMDIVKKKEWKKFMFQTKVVLTMTGILLVSGTLLLKFSENITWLGAFFQSVIARTAGFNTFPLSNFTQAGLLVMIILMFIGASPGSTGGGIKTTTLFVIVLKAVSSTFNQNRNTAFRRRIPDLVVTKALVVLFFGLVVVISGSYIIMVLEPGLSMSSIFVEVTSAFATVGASVGITPELCTMSKFVIMVIMFIGRLGPVTIASLWIFKEVKNIYYTEEGMMIG